jgi:cell division septation protein DedD
VKLDSYIQHLLQDHEMVIVPGFGAFISEYQPAEVDNDSDEIKPPSSRLVFNPQIKNNDGLLVGYVAEVTRSSHFEALQKIEKARDNMLYQLDKGEKVELIELGTFSRNEKNELVFESLSEKQHSLDSFGLEATALSTQEYGEPSEKEEEVEEKQAEEPPVVVPLVAEDSAPVEDEKQDGEDSVEKEQKEAIKENEEETAEEKEEESEEKEVIVVPPVIENPEEPNKEKKRKGGWIWLLVILIPLIAVSVFIVMKDKGSSETPATTPPETYIESAEEKPVAVADSTIADSTQIAVQDTISVEKEQTEEPVTSESKGPKFYLVGGSFQEKENAESYMLTLRDKGFEPFDMGMYGSYYIIGLGSYDTQAEALSAKEAMLEKNPGSGIWVLKR